MKPCTKTKFATVKLAEQRIKEIKGEYTAEGKSKPVRAYQCLRCGQWHLTSMSASEAKEKVERRQRSMLARERDDYARKHRKESDGSHKVRKFKKKF